MSVSQDTSAPAAGPGCGDKRRLRKTKTPGVYRRLDAGGKTLGYVAVIEAAGRQRKRSARTYAAACRVKRESETDRDRGELQEPTATTFVSFLEEWVERYRGQGRRGFRENSRDEYRRLIASYARPYFPAKLKLVDVTTFRLARFVDWLADSDAQGKRLSDATVANAVIPLRAALATATREGLIRHNPSRGLALPHREEVVEEREEEVKVFSEEQLAAVLAMAPERLGYKLLFEVLAAAGLRISEAIALQRLHLQLDGFGTRGLRAARDRQGPGRAAEVKARQARGAAACGAGVPAAGVSRRAGDPGLDRPGLPELERRSAEPRQRPPPCPQATGRGGQRAVGGLPHVPPHLRLAPPGARDQPPPAQPRARPPLGRVHAVPLHASAARRRGACADSRVVASLRRACERHALDRSHHCKLSRGERIKDETSKTAETADRKGAHGGRVGVPRRLRRSSPRIYRALTQGAMGRPKPRLI